VEEPAEASSPPSPDTQATAGPSKRRESPETIQRFFTKGFVIDLYAQARAKLQRPQFQKPKPVEFLHVLFDNIQPQKSQV